jgi:hypothetical protein
MMSCYMLTNLTGRQVLIRLNSGQTLFIEPGGRSGEIPGDEISDNTMVDKLLSRHIIAVNPVEAPQGNSPAYSQERKEPRLAPKPEPSPDSRWVEPDKITKPKKQSKPKSKGGK